MQTKKVIIVGAGIGGLATAIYLSREGYEVSVFEKNDFPGGRCANFMKDGHRFDIGATLLMMPETYREAYRLMGKEMEEELELYRMDPVYQIRFTNGVKLDFCSDLVKMKHQLEKLEEGSYREFLKYIQKGCRTFKESMEGIIDMNYRHIFDFINLKSLFILLRSKAFSNHYRYTRKHFKSPELLTALTFQNIYVGQNPFTAPGVFAILPSLEVSEGVYFPKGGMAKLTDSFLDIAKTNGVQVHCHQPVDKIVVENKKVTGVELHDGTFHPAGLVISNADVPYTYNELLPGKKLAQKMMKKKFACSAIVFHWALDKNFSELEQHNVFVADDYKKSMDSIFKQKTLPGNPSFYVHSPVKSDPTAAPADCDSLSVIVPAPNLSFYQDKGLEKIQAQAKAAVLKRLADEGMPRIEDHIKFERVYTRHSWKNIFNLTHGATFGSVNHDIMQMGYFRPKNQHPGYKNLFFTGGSTHPGNGMPMSLISAKLTTEKLLNFDKKQS